MLSIDPGMCRMLQAEIQSAVKYRVTTCTPEELIASPEPALGALVVSPPGVLPMIAEVLPKDRPPITVLYSSAEAHFEVVRKMTHPSVVAIVSISETFLKIACGLLGPRIGTRHTLIECLVDERKNARIPAADLLFCDAVTFPRVHAHRRAKNAIPYNLISSECLEQIVAMMPVQKKSTLKSAD